jgi:phospholipase C
MDGAYLIPDACNSDPTCTNNGKGQLLSYKYTDNPALTYNNAYGMGNTSVLGPYLAFAQQYGWANFMYQTNQGPSYPAHQFIFSGTSARTATDDLAATFIAENFSPQHTQAGCLAGSTSFSRQISPNPNPSVCAAGCVCYDNNTVQECKISNNPPLNDTFCYGHDTMDTLLGSANWKYYAPSQGSIWTAPDSFSALCAPVVNGMCTGPAFTGPNPNVVISKAQVLTDIKNNCKLAPVTWIIPDGRWSDHASSNDGTGPSWVAAVVNEIGGFQNTCGFWNNTAIVITWDDWGGWSDNQKPVVLNPVNGQGDYQYGFRVPMIVVSAYTPQGYINNATHDFGSILRMIQAINGIPEGSLNFADLRATNDLHAFFSLTTPRPYTIVPAVKDPSYFINFIGAPTAPDNDDDDQ